jgi:hypothetical protein
MKNLLDIAKLLEGVKNIASNTAIWVKSLVFIVIVGGTFTIGAISFSETKVQKSDCTSYIEENRLLINALIEIKRDLTPITTTSYVMDEDFISFMYASYDTIPKEAKPTQHQIKVKAVLSKIDSILLKSKELDKKRKIKG